MKFIVTEDQLDYMKSFNSIKNAFFKYWDKFGGKADSVFFNMFGFDYNSLETNNITITKSSVYELLREWYGEENALKKSLEFLTNTKHRIDDCGGYNFDFEIEIGETDIKNGTIYVRSFPDYETGTVELIMVGGEIRPLSDAVNDEDYGYEISHEITECIHDYFMEKITNTFGLYVIGY